jgi:hypothetical protein
MDLKAPQHSNTALSIRVSFELGSNENDESDEQEAKHRAPRTSTDDGMQMLFNEKQYQNVTTSIRASFEPGSNNNDESEEHW